MKQNHPTEPRKPDPRKSYLLHVSQPIPRIPPADESIASESSGTGSELLENTERSEDASVTTSESIFATGEPAVPNTDSSLPSAENSTADQTANSHCAPIGEDFDTSLPDPDLSTQELRQHIHRILAQGTLRLETSEGLTGANSEVSEEAEDTDARITASNRPEPQHVLMPGILLEDTDEPHSRNPEISDSADPLDEVLNRPYLPLNHSDAVDLLGPLALARPELMKNLEQLFQEVDARHSEEEQAYRKQVSLYRETVRNELRSIAGHVQTPQPLQRIPSPRGSLPRVQVNRVTEAPPAPEDEAKTNLPLPQEVEIPLPPSPEPNPNCNPKDSIKETPVTDVTESLEAAAESEAETENRLQCSNLPEKKPQVESNPEPEAAPDAEIAESENVFESKEDSESKPESKEVSNFGSNSSMELDTAEPPEPNSPEWHEAQVQARARARARKSWFRLQDSLPSQETRQALRLHLNQSAKRLGSNLVRLSTQIQLRRVAQQELRTTAGRLYAASLPFATLLFLISYLLNTNLTNRVETSVLLYALSNILLPILALLLPMLALLKRHPIEPKYLMGSAQTSPAAKLFSGLLAIPFLLTCTGVTSLLTYSLQLLHLSPNTNSWITGPAVLIQPRLLGVTPIVFLLYCLLEPVLEELFFRGLLLGLLLDSGHVRLTILTQAIAYALYRPEPLFWCAPFLLGLFLGVVRSVMRDLRCSILAHILYRMGMFILFLAFPQLQNLQYLVGTQSGAVLIQISLVLLAIGLMILLPSIALIRGFAPSALKRKLDSHPTALPSEEQHWPFEWLFILTAVGYFLLKILF